MRRLEPETSLKLLGATVVGLSLILSGLVLWLSLNPDPWGGEPYVILPLEERLADRLATSEPSLPPATAPLALSEDGLTEAGRYGPLPRIAPDGRAPRLVYAKPAPPGFLQRPNRPPAVVLVVAGLGMDAELTFQAIDRLPAAVTLAFDPYGRGLNRWGRIARDNDHEVLLEVPLEPYDYPDNDPGPHTLLTRSSSGRNLDRLHWVLSRMGGYVGLLGRMGTRFSAKAEALAPILQDVKLRGLLYVDNGLTSASQAKAVARRFHLPFLQASQFVNGRSAPEEVRLALSRLEALAKRKGLAIGIVRAPTATLITKLTGWTQSLSERGIQLVALTTGLALKQGNS